MDFVNIPFGQLYQSMSFVIYKTWAGGDSPMVPNILIIPPSIFAEMVNLFKMLQDDGRYDWISYIINSMGYFDNQVLPYSPEDLQKPSPYSEEILEKVKEIVLKSFEEGQIEVGSIMFDLLTGHNFNREHECSVPHVHDNLDRVIDTSLYRGYFDFVEELIEKYPEHFDIDYVFTICCLHNGDKAKEMYQEDDGLQLGSYLFEDDCGNMTLDTFKWLMEVKENRMRDIIWIPSICRDGRTDILDYIVQNYPDILENEDMEMLISDLGDEFLNCDIEEICNNIDQSLQYLSDTFPSHCA